MKKEAKRQTAFRLSESILSRLEQESESQDRSMNKLVERILDEKLPSLDLGGKIASEFNPSNED